MKDLLVRRIAMYGILLFGLVVARCVQGSEVTPKKAGEEEQNLLRALAQARALNEEAAKMNRSEAAIQWYEEDGASALLYLARAIHFAPQSSLAAEQAIVILNAWKMPPVLSAEFKSDVLLLNAQFSDDGNYLLSERYIGGKNIVERVWEIKAGMSVETKAAVPERAKSGGWRVTLLDGREIQFHSALDDRIKDSGMLTPPPGTRPDAADLAGPVWSKILRGYAAAKQDREANIYTAAFSPDHRRIVTGDDDVRVWDVATGQLLLTFNKPISRFYDHPILSARYSPDGSRILSIVEKQPASIWDGATGTLVAVLRSKLTGPEGKGGVIYAAFSRDGRQVVTTSVKDVVQVWKLSHPDVAPPPVLPTNAGPPPEWFTEFLYFMAERRFDEDGQEYLFRGFDLRAMRDHLQSVLNAATDSKSPYLEVLRYYLKYQAESERSE